MTITIQKKHLAGIAVMIGIVIAVLGFSVARAAGDSDTIREMIVSRLLDYALGADESMAVGGTTNLDALALDSGLTVGGAFTVGSAGDPMSRINFNTCNANLGGGAITASTTKTFWCADSDVDSGDKIFVTMASTSPSINFILVGAEASTTDGYVGFTFLNTGLTAGNALPGATATTGLQYFVVN